MTLYVLILYCSSGCSVDPPINGSLWADPVKCEQHGRMEAKARSGDWSALGLPATKGWSFVCQPIAPERGISISVKEKTR